MVFPPQEGVEIIWHQQNLCHVEQQCDGVVEVGVGAAGIDPEVPENREQSGAGEQHAAHQEDVPQESVQVTPHRQEGHVESDVSHSGVGLKDGDHSQLHEDEKHWMLLEFDGQRDGVEEDIDLEDAEEEEAEVFKHLGEEIPEEADVGGQVRNWEDEAIDGRQEVPGAEQEEGEADDDEEAAQVHEGVLNDEPPEAGTPEVHRDVLTLHQIEQRGGAQSERIDGLVRGQGQKYSTQQHISFDCGEDEEGEDGVVQAAGRLGYAGQDGERVQQVKHSDLQRDVEHFFGASDELQTVEGIAIGLQCIFLLSEHLLVVLLHGQVESHSGDHICQHKCYLCIVHQKVKEVNDEWGLMENISRVRRDSQVKQSQTFNNSLPGCQRRHHLHSFRN